MCLLSSVSKTKFQRKSDEVKCFIAQDVDLLCLSYNLIILTQGYYFDKMRRPSIVACALQATFTRTMSKESNLWQLVSGAKFIFFTCLSFLREQTLDLTLVELKTI